MNTFVVTEYTTEAFDWKLIGFTYHSHGMKKISIIVMMFAQQLCGPSHWLRNSVIINCRYIIVSTYRDVIEDNLFTQTPAI